MSPLPGGAGHGAALRRSIFCDLDVEELGFEKRCDRLRQPVGIGDDAVADAERALGRLDQAMDMVEALGLGDAQPRKQAEDDERGQPWVGGGAL